MSPFPQVLELWGGVECTHNRVGDRYFDQLDRSGHATRVGDLDLIASLGVSSLRYPVLWERVVDERGVPHWDWADERLDRLRELGVRPVVGLLHHGSGPTGSSLLDDDLPERFAAFARSVAERYPWIEAYAPVNEPLTTARFAGLYGVWHPHGNDVATMARLLLHQCRAVVLAMRAIRAVNPDAQLIQNEDVGRIFSTPALRAEADLQNERRWLTFDLLCGRVDREHPLWSYLAVTPTDVRLLEQLVDEPCPPDVMGIDYYITSERMLDERVDRYPDRRPTNDGHVPHVDVEAVRVCDRLNGWAGAIRETWQRYHRPMAVTEAHLACTREEQLRWLRDSWRTCTDMLASGVPIQALTVWSLFGAFDWDRLVTEEGTFYEPGAFDVSGPEPRTTAVAEMMRALATEGAYDVPAMAGPGWWDRPDRFHYPVVYVHEAGSGPVHDPVVSERGRPQRRLLILGGDTPVGRVVAEACARRGLAFTSTPEDAGPALSPSEGIIGWLDPWGVVDATTRLDVDRAERAPAEARDRAARTIRWGRACDRRGIPMAVLSTDQVFDGTASGPYREDDPVGPRTALGTACASIERALEDSASTLIVRTGPLFGFEQIDERADALACILRSASSGRPVRAAVDRIESPTYGPHLVDVVLDLLIDRADGIWHVANEGAVSPADMVRAALISLELDPELVQPLRSLAGGRSAERPAYTALTSARGRLLPALNESLTNFLTVWATRERTQQAA